MVVTNGTEVQGSEALILHIIQLPELRQRLPVLGVWRDCLAMIWGRGLFCLMDVPCLLTALWPRNAASTAVSATGQGLPQSAAFLRGSGSFGAGFGVGRLPNFYPYPTVQAGSGRNLFGN